MPRHQLKPPGPDAARQPENQRRHRARTNLSSKSKSLTAEVNRLHGLSIPSRAGPRFPRLSKDTLQILSSSFHQADGLIPPSPCGTAPNQSTAAAAPEQVQFASTQTMIDCPLLPAPGAGESTIPCQNAYLIIKERSSPEFDLSAANEWLMPEFRRAIATETGCPLSALGGCLPKSMSHHNPLGHISIGVRNYDIAKVFYTAVLAPLGLHLVYDSEVSTPGTKKIRTLGYGPNAKHELVNIFEFGDDASPPGPGFHLAFDAPSRDAVVEFHAQAMAAGGTDNGLPGVRKHYGANYFAAFVVDPDGWRLEAVCKE
ncbi:Glyoxalase/Bleomycin resistance protein/Dihydroxybiphenyl dioxygenase [Parathielavia appendiculata]|uniref:Glyoxalase/Bleomycin resistance protein/Dihydroxybiphenyl dioxygenase n=1 Tax=Parathielavia appendiculata TaxID=2587402 RepID=A0AAN6YY72_9PEZI|nr:Glyoxalase/Bleomycin resistance protein/Dihydroxybiphenyl dioxygenase [Parathielavia appendiculata]